MAKIQRARVAFVDDEEHLAVSLADKFSDDYETVAFTSPAKALAQINASFAVVVSDQRMPGMTGDELLAQLRVKLPDTIRILLTAVPEKQLFEVFPRLINEGHIFRFVPKEALASDHLKNVLLDAVDLFAYRQEQKLTLLKLNQETKQLRAQLRLTIGEERTFEDLLGQDPCLKEAIEKGRWAADNIHLQVLITGETGTGKDILARAIHYEGISRGKPFIALNCAVYSKELIRSELMGYAKGSHDKAFVASEGTLRKADGGTVFLDEIGELPLDVQGMFLSFLQDGVVQPLGEAPTRLKLGVRIIAATNRDLDTEVQKGTFRLDLLQRLKRDEIIRLPPLRERLGDIEALARHALITAASRYDLEEITISQGALNKLKQLSYPGNVRELYSTVSRAVNCMLRSRRNTLDIEDLRDAIEVQKNTAATTSSLEEATEEFRKNMVRKALLDNKTKVAAAEALGMTDRNLRELIRKYGL